jgi:predicted lipoprotein with Yx(FWY)xxD motif
MYRLPLRLLPVLALAAVASLVLAACGSSNDSSGSTTTAASATPTTASSSSGGSAAVDLADNSALGTQILVDGQGRTLYLFEKDTSADKSACSGACAGFWPPLTTKGDATAGSGLDSSQLTTFKRDDGTTQVAYAGHPLYYYSGDAAPGDANGNGIDKFGAEWYAMDSSGDTVESGGSSDESSGGETSTTDTGGGYSPSY